MKRTTWTSSIKVLKSSKMGPHFSRKAYFSPLKSFWPEVLKARFHLWKHCLYNSSLCALSYAPLYTQIPYHTLSVALPIKFMIIMYAPFNMYCIICNLSLLFCFMNPVKLLFVDQFELRSIVHPVEVRKCQAGPDVLMSVSLFDLMPCWQYLTKNLRT